MASFIVSLIQIFAFAEFSISVKEDTGIGGRLASKHGQEFEVPEFHEFVRVAKHASCRLDSRRWTSTLMSELNRTDQQVLGEFL